MSQKKKQKSKKTKILVVLNQLKELAPEMNKINMFIPSN